MLKKNLKSFMTSFLVPIDKADNNVAIICKHFYAKTLYREIDYSNITDNVENGNTYSKIVNLNSKQVFSTHSNFLKSSTWRLRNTKKKMQSCTGHLRCIKKLSGTDGLRPNYIQIEI